MFVPLHKCRKAVCGFGVITGVLYRKNSVPRKIVAVCAFGVITGGDIAGEECMLYENSLK